MNGRLTDLPKFRTQVTDRLRKGVVIPVPYLSTLLLRGTDIKTCSFPCTVMVMESKRRFRRKIDVGAGIFPHGIFVELLVFEPRSTARDEMAPHLGP